MTKPPEINYIVWQEWNQEAFLAARREQKPILLTLSATWCHWCHVMDDTSYSDPRIIDLVNSRFIPVRVDVDQRPDVSRRYNQGGFPSVAILDGQGDLIAGQIYKPPDEMVVFLEEILSGNASAPPASNIQRRDDSSGSGKRLDGAVEQSPTSSVMEHLQDLYDADFGGFGLEPKQPPWEGIRFLMAQYSRTRRKHLLKMITGTLDGVLGLYDQKDQGFFRYSVARDWRVPHYEKMLVTNANMAMLYLEGYQLTGRKAYQDVAVGALGYLLTTLYDRTQGVFYSSQDAWEEYYHLPWKDRGEAVKPPIDTTVYTGWNALAASALITGFNVLGTPCYFQVADNLLQRLWSETWNPGHGITHMWGGPAEQPLVLEDHVYVLSALLSLYQSTGRPELLDRAISLATLIQNRFAASDGGFHDTSGDAGESEELLPEEKPVLENSLLTEELLIMACLTGKDEYRALARTTLEIFEPVVPGTSYLGPQQSRRMEEDEERLFLPAGSAWARALDMLSCGLVELVVVGTLSRPETSGILKAVLKSYVPHRVVQTLDPERDGDRIASLGFPVSNTPALYLCMNSVCLAPVTTRQDVRRLLKARPWEMPAPQLH